MAYVLTRDDALNKAYISLSQFGKGTNNLGRGTYTASANNVFNGSYKIIKTIERTMETVAGIVDHNNDACFYDGKIFELPAPTSTSGLVVMIHKFTNFGTAIETERVMIEHRNSDGSALNHEKEGIAIYHGRMYIGSHAAGIFIYEY